MQINQKPKIAFICVHNSCRSQIAEFLAKRLASDTFEAYSAGTEIKPQINQDAVRLIKEEHGIDISKTQYSKLIEEIPTPDIVIKMGCEVTCPYLKSNYEEDWGLDDPTGKSDEAFEMIIKQIEKNIVNLKNRIIAKEINWKGDV